MMDLEQIRLAFRGWLNTAGVDLTKFVFENVSTDVSAMDVFVEEHLEKLNETTNTSVDSIMRGIATYYVTGRKGVGTHAIAAMVTSIGDTFQPSARKDQTIDTAIRLCVEEVYESAGADFQSSDSVRWRVPVRVIFRAYETN